MKKLLNTLAIVLVSSLALAQTTTENFIKNTAYQIETPTGSVSADDKIESITYFDGLGRPMQRVGIRAGGNREHIITHVAYDDYGRQDKAYLPYATTANSGLYRTDALTATNSFYATTKYENTLNPYSEKNLEASPLSRVLEQGAPGLDWAVDMENDTDHTIKFGYAANTDSDFVRRFSVNFIGGNTEKPELIEDVQMVYEPSSLYKTITKDENWQPGQTYPNEHTTEEYKDKQGRVVLKRTFDKQKWLDTYYVYDDFGNLTYVIPPKVMTYHPISQPYIDQEHYIYWDTYISKRRLGTGGFRYKRNERNLRFIYVFWFYGFQYSIK